MVGLKAVQTIGFLSHLRQKGILRPYLIIGPLSTTPNWVNEFKRFARVPGDPVPRHEAGPRGAANEAHADERQDRAEFPVVVTSFEIVMADRGSCKSTTGSTSSWTRGTG